MNNICYCFPQGRSKALTLSFDDGRMEDRRLVLLLNRYGIKCTFNLNSGVQADNRIDSAEYAALYAGHEIASHTVSHPSLAAGPFEQVACQILEDRRALEAITHDPVRGMAYPNGSYSSEIKNLLPGLGIRYARTVKSSGTFDMPTDFWEWNPTCHFRQDLQKQGERFVVLDKPKKMHLLYVWGHSYELPERNGWNEMEAFCKQVANRPDIWYATNIEIADYADALSRLRFTVDLARVHNPSATSCWIRVDQHIYEIPAGCTVSLS